MPNTVSNWFAWLLSQMEASSKDVLHTEAHKQFAEDKHTEDMNYWKPVLCSDETKINLFGLAEM